MNQHAYTLPEIASAVNVSESCIDQWIARGYFAPAHDAEKGKARYYSLPEVVLLAIAVRLREIGIPADRAFAFARKAMANNNKAHAVLCEHRGIRCLVNVNEIECESKKAFNSTIVGNGLFKRAA